MILGLPFEDLNRELARLVSEPTRDHISQKKDNSNQLTRLDPRRERRTGIPEIIHGEKKRAEEVVQSLASLANATGRAIASRCPEKTIEAVRDALHDAYTVTIHEVARMVVVAQTGVEAPESGGRIGILAAGSSDVPVATEAAVVAREMGCAVSLASDVGVAGLHRLIEPLARMMTDQVDVLVVAAGMDGALPSVVAGLVPVPVIGLPTSIGYGAGGEGKAALLAMLQACAPGLVVVNIDNGIGAGSTAALIANRVAGARNRQVGDLRPAER